MWRRVWTWLGSSGGVVLVGGLVALAACGDDTTGAGGSGGSGASGATGSATGATSTSAASGGGGGCNKCSQALEGIQAGTAVGTLCPGASTALYVTLVMCVCGDMVCGGATGACATTCGPEKDPNPSATCLDCFTTAFDAACKTQADACAAD